MQVLDNGMKCWRSFNIEAGNSSFRHSLMIVRLSYLLEIINAKVQEEREIHSFDVLDARGLIYLSRQCSQCGVSL